MRITNTFPEGQLIDITRELTGTPVHPGNPVPELARIRRMEDGAANVGILEGLDLSQAPEGNAFVMAQPLKISGSEGAPCRALLYIIKQDVTQT